MKLTKKIIDGLTWPRHMPVNRRYIVWDDVSGFGVRVYPTGSKVYVVKYRIGRGRNTRQRLIVLGDVSLFEGVEEARHAARKALLVARGGEDPFAEVGGEATPTVQLMLDRFLKEAKVKPSTLRNYKIAARKLNAILGRYLVRNVTRADVMRARDKMAQTSESGAHNAIRVLSTAFGQAELWGWIPHRSNPVYKIPGYKTKKTMKYLTPAQVTSLVDQLDRDNPYHNVIEILLYTGARASEILYLKWSEVDLEAGRLNLEDSKTGPKSIVLPSQAVELIRKQPTRFQEYVFTPPYKTNVGPTKKFYAEWKALLKAAGIKGITPHDLRHNAASWLAQAGENAKTVKDALGHSKIEMTDRYMHLGETEVKTAIQKLADNLESQGRALAGSGVQGD